jgi:hypothetical protein
MADTTTTMEPERAEEARDAERDRPRETTATDREREVVREEPVEAHADRPAPGRAKTDGGPLLPPDAVTGFQRRWESIQTAFIDAPRESVAQADRLVADLTDRIAESFRDHRSELEGRWHRGEDVTTEELRQSLQRYRSFFDRLLHL